VFVPSQDMDTFVCLCQARTWIHFCVCAKPGHGYVFVFVPSQDMDTFLCLCQARTWIRLCVCAKPGHGYIFVFVPSQDMDTFLCLCQARTWIRSMSWGERWFSLFLPYPKHAVLRRKSKDWLVWNQDNLSEWGTYLSADCCFSELALYKFN
jgi:hypothetical protein